MRQFVPLQGAANRGGEMLTKFAAAMGKILELVLKVLSNILSWIGDLLGWISENLWIVPITVVILLLKMFRIL